MARESLEWLLDAVEGDTDLITNWIRNGDKDEALEALRETTTDLRNAKDLLAEYTKRYRDAAQDVKELTRDVRGM